MASGGEKNWTHVRAVVERREEETWEIKFPAEVSLELFVCFQTMKGNGNDILRVECSNGVDDRENGFSVTQPRT